MKPPVFLQPGDEVRRPPSASAVGLRRRRASYAWLRVPARSRLMLAAAFIDVLYVYIYRVGGVLHEDRWWCGSGSLVS
jgi:hypothetical protein